MALEVASTGSPWRVALCVARFYSELAERLERGAREQLSEAGVFEVSCYDVPGAFELPLIAKLAAESGRFDAVVCLGAVIRGETDHYDYVCSAASDGILRVALDTGVPCGFGVLDRRHDGAGARARGRRREARQRPARGRGGARVPGGA